MVHVNLIRYPEGTQYDGGATVESVHYFREAFGKSVTFTHFDNRSRTRLILHIKKGTDSRYVFARKVSHWTMK